MIWSAASGSALFFGQVENEKFIGYFGGRRLRINLKPETRALPMPLSSDRRLNVLVVRPVTPATDSFGFRSSDFFRFSSFGIRLSPIPFH
jgi:hypothetical protein